MRWVLIAVAVLVVFMIGSKLLSAKAAPAVGSLAPDFTLTSQKAPRSS